MTKDMWWSLVRRVRSLLPFLVTIENGVLVKVGGTNPADGFTNNPNYTGFGGHGSKTGTFGNQGAAIHPLSQGPGF